MKKIHIKSAVPIYISAAVWLIAGLLLPKMLLKIPTLMIVALVSALAGFVSKRFFPGRDIEVEDKIKTGDAALDEEIETGRKRLASLRIADAAIEHPGVSANLERMVAAGDQVFAELGKDKGKYALVRRFMSYYLPTAEKLIEQYRTLMAARVKGENVIKTMQRIEGSLDMITNAFEKCLDNLYKDQEMDIDAEIQVMRTMLSSDGLIDNPKEDREDSGIRLTLGGK